MLDCLLVKSYSRVCSTEMCDCVFPPYLQVAHSNIQQQVEGDLVYSAVKLIHMYLVAK
jgi:hypothetical protein